MTSELKAIIIKNLEMGNNNFLMFPPVLIPKPKEIINIEQKKAYFLTSECTFRFINLNNQDFLLNDLNEFLNQISNVVIKKFDPDDSDFEIINNKSKNSLLNVNNKDGYNLEIKKNRIIIHAIDEKGIFYGIQTLIQLIKNGYLTNETHEILPKNNHNKLILPEIEIKDIPDLKIRGIAQDISRGQVFTVENAKRYVKILSHYKMNFYCLYIEDMFAHPKHPLIGKERGALTSEEIKEIDKFAKERYVELVPIFECLGHLDNILQHDKYSNLAEFPGAFCLDISNPEIYSFLSDYISEMSKCFSTNYFHIGCDESFDIGRYRSKEFIEKHGKSEALIDLYEKVYKITKENNNEHVIMYDDIVRHDDKILNNLNKDLIMMYWDYAPKKTYPLVKKFLNTGYKVIVSPSMLSWQRHFPDNKNSSKNIINLTKVAYENRNNGCLGVITCTWGDMKYYSLRENEIFGAILNGAISWTTPNFNYQTFKRDYGLLFYGIEKKYLEKFNEMFTLLSNSPSLYYKISLLIPPLFFTYLFKHPFPKKDFKPYFDKYEKLGNLANKCLEIYNEIKPKVHFESKNFEYIEFSAELAKYLREKIDISLKVSNILNNSEINKKDAKNAIADLNYIRNKFIYLKEKFEKLWLRAAKRPCLDVILKLFDFVIEKYNEKIIQINKGIFFVDPYLTSEWIWGIETSDSNKPCYFRKTIEINQPIKKAIIQCIACNHAKIFINNKFIGEVLSRYSMSILPIVLRVKTFDITKYLQEGTNIIAIEAISFDGLGAINIYGQIQFKNDLTQEIITNKTWICNQEDIFKEKGWLKLEYNDREWKPSKSYGRPPNLNGDIFKPDLLNGEISFTQDYFGFEGYSSNFLSESSKELIENTIKIMEPYG